MSQQLRSMFLYLDLFTKENYGNCYDFRKSSLSIWEHLVFSQVAEQQTHFK